MRNRKLKSVLSTVASNVLAIGILLLVLIPFLWLADSSFKPGTELFTNSPSWFVKNMNLDGYRWILNPAYGKIMKPLENSLIISGATTLMTMVFALTAGYTVARFKFPGLALFMGLLFICQMFQGPLIMIPWYKIASLLHITNTKLVLILVYGTITIPLTVVMMSGFFRAIPGELEQAAYLDGCTRFQAMMRIDFPLVKPGMVAVAIMAFINAWNDYQYALILTSSPEAKTVQIRINDIIQAVGNVNWSGLLAAGVIATMPVVILFAIIQRYLIDGLTAGAVKG